MEETVNVQTVVQYWEAASRLDFQSNIKLVEFQICTLNIGVSSFVNISLLPKLGGSYRELGKLLTLDILNFSGMDAFPQSACVKTGLPSTYCLIFLTIRPGDSELFVFEPFKTSRCCSPSVISCTLNTIVDMDVIAQAARSSIVSDGFPGCLSTPLCNASKNFLSVTVLYRKG